MKNHLAGYQIWASPIYLEDGESLNTLGFLGIMFTHDSQNVQIYTKKEEQVMQKK